MIGQFIVFIGLEVIVLGTGVACKVHYMVGSNYGLTSHCYWFN